MVHDRLIQQAGRAEGEEDAANEDGPANYEPAGMRAHSIDGTLAQASFAQAPICSHACSSQVEQAAGGSSQAAELAADSQLGP